MSKERLEEINNFSSLPLKKRISLTKESIKKELKANDYHLPKNININTQYLLEIIEQAERVYELERKIERYREALEFYADRENYEPEHYDPDTHDYTSMIDHDKGATACKALGRGDYNE